ncbi:tyrosine-type recombinase/integrase [Marinobacter sp. S6332]|uniref:tyrosine-type recombinase/integrase n=1 Tax=Marinobacter sp. S6332 TaxID=2926403 RepID=UPI001FF510E2|nr:tyrosine-type recombinase/integrase [Marinobacter sp. S6332]MCK0162683.1 integrase arm-type DNA-binding domain-containing protein [Marinobacter sp. S6332]
MAVKNRELIPKSADSADKLIRTLTPSQKDTYIQDSTITGLVLRVTPSGKKLWHLRYTVQIGSGQWVGRKYSLGAFCEGLKTRSAREQAETWRVRIRQGEDPQEEKKKQAEQRKAEHLLEIERKQALRTLNDVAVVYAAKLANKKKGHKDGGTHAMTILHNHLLDRFGTIPIQEFTRQDFFSAIDPILAAGHNSMANTVLSYTKAMFRLAVKREFIEYSVLDCLDKTDVGGKDKIRSRVLCATRTKADELEDLYRILPDSGLSLNLQCVVHILLGTGCRGIELFKGRWDHLNFDNNMWLIPGEHSKNEDPIIIYLSEYSKKWFSELYKLTGHTNWMMPGKSKKRPHMIPKVLSKAICERQRAPEAPQKKGRTRNHSTLILPDGHWTVHDLRRTAATQMQMLEVTPDIIDACQNHRPLGVRRRYQHGHSMDQMRAAWDLLGRSLAAKADVHPPTN